MTALSTWPWNVQRCEDKESRAAAKDFVNEHHSYIQWADRPSRKMYWLLFEEAQLCGVFGLGSCFHRPKAVKEFMDGGDLGFNEVANNIVYCLNGCQLRNSGTKFLSLCRRDAVEWWGERYGDDLKAFQTFILPPRTGAVYKADNWSLLGETSAGTTQSMRTLYGDEIEKHPEAEKRVFKNGEVKYLLREYRKTEPKLIYMRMR